MPKVNLSTKLPVSAEAVWSMIGNFNAMTQWHPAIEKSEESTKDGATIRTLTLAGGAGKVIERLESHDNNDRSCTYSIVAAPLPVADYESTIRVKADTPMTCTVEWSSEFEADGASENDAVSAIREVYESGFENLRRMFGGK